jgi:hypothetical protein
MKLRILIAGLVFGIAALAAESGAELFQKAVTEERASGNLEEAIKLYQRVAKEFASDRPLAAKALVQAAHCYELLGQDKHDNAVKLYEQVARDFGDQRESSAAASARLVVLRQGERAAEPATMTQRKIEIAGASGDVYADGQRALYRDAATGALVISDMVGKNKRVVFKLKPGDSLDVAPSRDLSVTLMGFRRSQDPGYIVAVIKTDGSGYHEIAVGKGSFSTSQPSWSWDNRFILGGTHFPDDTRRLLRIAAADGSTQEVLRREASISSASFSPDGRFIAYSEGFPAGIRTFVLPSQGGEPQLISGNATLIDWTRDGRYLAVASTRSGTAALQLLPVKDGKPAGEPVFVRYGSFLEGRTTTSGALLYESYPDAGSFEREWTADLDPDGRPGSWKRLDPGSSGSFWPVPTWSPDSNQIAWTVAREDTGQAGFVVRLRNLATGKERDLYRGTGMTNCIWAARHPNLFCSEVASDGTTTSIFSIAVESGRTEQLGAVPGRGILESVALPNDQAVYFLRQTPGELTRWDIGTGQETLLEHDAFNLDLDVEPSPDGGWLKRFLKGNIETRPMSGGDWKPSLPLSAGGQSGFSPDGKWIFYHNKDAAGKDGLYRVATAGGSPERLGDFPTGNVSGTLCISPDGRKIIALAHNDEISYDTWLLENFEPKQQATR